MGDTRAGAVASAAPDDLEFPALPAPSPQQQQPDAGVEFPAPQAAAQPSAPLGSPENPLRGLVEFAQKLDEAQQVGQGGFRESAIGHSVMDGRITLEDAEKQIDADERAKWLSEDVDAYERNAWHNWATAIPVSIGIETAKALPFIGASTAAWGAGAATGAGATAATGVGAPVAAHVGALTGLATSAAWAADYLTGQEYLRRRREGASDGEAKTWASISGLGQGLINAVQFRNLAKVPVDAAKVPLELAKPSLEKAIAGFGNYAGGLAKFVGQQAALSEASQAADLITRAIEGTVHHHAGMVPTVQDAAREFSQTLAQTIATSAALHAGGTVAGKAVGFTGKQFLSVLQQAHDEHLAVQQEKAQAQAEAQAQQQESTAARLAGKVEENVGAPEKPLTKAEQKRRGEAGKLDTLKGNHKAALKARIDAEEEIEAADRKIEQIKTDVEVRKQQLKQLANNAKGRAVYSGESADFHDAAYFEKEAAKLNAKTDEVKRLQLRKEQARQQLRAAKELEQDMSREIGRIEKKNLKQAKERLTRVVSKIQSPKQSGQPNSRLARGTDIQSVLNKVKEFIENPVSMAAAKSKYDAAEKSGALTPDLQRDMDIANFVGDLGDATAADINKLADRIEAAYKEGRAGRIKELADAAEARHQLLDQVIDAFNGNTKRGFELQSEIDKLEAAGEPVPDRLRKQLEAERAKTSVSSGPNPMAKEKLHIPFFARNLVNIFGNWPGMIRTFARNSSDPAAIVRRLYVGDILNGIDAGHRENVATLYKNLEAATGLPTARITELIRKGAKKRIVVDVNGEAASMTVNEAMDKLAQWEDPEAREALMAGNGYAPENPFVPSTTERIEQALNDVDPAYNKLWRGYVKTYKEIYPRLAAEYKAKTGEDLPNNPFYSGPMLHLRYSGELTARDFNSMLEQGAKGRRNVAVSSPGSTKARTGDTSALAYRDIDSKFKNYSRHTENWIGWRKPMADTFGPIMGSVRVNTIIKNKFGPDALRAWHESFEDMVFGRADKISTMDRFVDRFVLRNIPFSVLAGKPFMFVKHVVSTANGARYIPAADYVRGMVEFYSDPFKHAKEIGETIEFQGRHAGHELDTLSSLQTPEKMEHPWSVAMQHWMMAPTIYGIRSEAAQMYAIAKYFERQGLSKKEAMVKADQAVHESQVSGRTDMRANLARGGNFAHLLFAFQSQVNSQAVDVTNSWDRFHAMPTKENFTDAVKASTAAAFTTATFESFNAAYQYMTATDDKERNTAAFDFVMRPLIGAVPFLGFPIVREATRNGIAGAFNLYAMSQGDEPPLFLNTEESSLAGTFAKAGTSLYQDAAGMIRDDDWIAEHFFKLMYDVNALASPFVKTPLGPPLHSADKMQKLSEQ